MLHSAYEGLLKIESSIYKTTFGPWMARTLYGFWHLFWDVYFSFRAVFRGWGAIIQIGDESFSYDMRDKTVGRILYLFGEYEKGETILLRSLLRPGMTFVDIGANSGYFTLVGARAVGITGHVLSFEPSPVNMNILRNNIGSNNLVNVTTVEMGICEGSRKLKLYISSINPGDHRTYDGSDDLTHNAGKPRVAIDIMGVGLDEYVEARDLSIDAIKMDIQGSEWYALRGMLRTLSVNPNIILMTEYWPHGLMRAGCSPSVYLDELQSLGFQPYLASENGTPQKATSEALKSVETDLEHATLFLTKQKLR